MRRQVSSATVVFSSSVLQKNAFSTTRPVQQQQRFDEFWSQHGLPGHSAPNYTPNSTAPDLHKTPVDKGTGTSHTTDPYLRTLPNVHLSAPVSSVTSTSAATTSDPTRKAKWSAAKLASHWAPLSEWFSPSVTGNAATQEDNPLMMTLLEKLRIPLRSVIKQQRGSEVQFDSSYLKLTSADVNSGVAKFAALAKLQTKLLDAMNGIPEFEVDRVKEAFTDVVASDPTCQKVGIVPTGVDTKKTPSLDEGADESAPSVELVLAVLGAGLKPHNTLISQWEKAVASRLSAGPQLWSSFFAQVESHWANMFLPPDVAVGDSTSEDGGARNKLPAGAAVYPNPADPRMHCTTHPIKALWEQAASGGDVKQPPTLKPSAALYFLHVLTADRSSELKETHKNLQGCGGGGLNATVDVASLDVNSALFGSTFPKSSSDLEGGTGEGDSAVAATIGQSLDQLNLVRHHLFSKRQGLLEILYAPSPDGNTTSLALRAAASIPHFPRQLLEAVQILVAMRTVQHLDQRLVDDLVNSFMGHETDSRNIVGQLTGAERTKDFVKQVLGVGGDASKAQGSSSVATGVTAQQQSGTQWMFSASTRWKKDRRKVLAEIFTNVDCLNEAKVLISQQFNSTRSAAIANRMGGRSPISRPTIGKMDKLVVALEAVKAKTLAAERNVMNSISDAPDLQPLLSWYSKLGIPFNATSAVSTDATSGVQTEAIPVSSLIAEVERRHPAWVKNDVFRGLEKQEVTTNRGGVSTPAQLETLVKIFVRLTVLPQTAEAVLRQRYQRRMGPVGRQSHQHNIPVEVGQAEHSNNEEYKQYDWQGWYQRMWDIHLRNVTMRIRLSDLKGSLANDGHPLLDLQGERRLRILSGERVGGGIVKLDSDRYEDREHNWEHGHHKVQQLLSESRKTMLGKEYWPTVEVKVRKPSGQSKMHYSVLDWDRVEEEASANYKKYAAKKKEVISVQPQMTWLEAPEEEEIYTQAAQSPSISTVATGDAPVKGLGSNLFVNAEDLFNELE